LDGLLAPVLARPFPWRGLDLAVHGAPLRRDRRTRVGNVSEHSHSSQNMAAATSPFLSSRQIVPSVPALPGLPILGNILQFRRDRLGMHDEAAEVGPVTRFNILHIPL